jgi:serine/threonine protein kinase
MQLWSSRPASSRSEAPDTDVLPGGHGLSGGTGLPSGQRIGAWHVIQRLHQGARCDLHAAQPSDAVGSNRCDYVLKVARRDIRQAASAAATVQREAAVAAQVKHPHLIAVLDAGSVDQQSYIAVPRLDGFNMARVLALRPSQPLPVALWWTRQIASALSAMHSAGWCHGDVKPAHVMVGTRGHLTLIDLGLARPCHASTASHRSTIAYAAPETLGEHAVALPASDIYSLGLVLHQVITGTDPLVSEPSTLGAERRAGKRPPLIAGEGTFGARAAAIVERVLATMLDPRPDQRPSAAELVQSLLALETLSLSQHIDPRQAA